MASQLTPLGKIAKWILLPGLLAAGGFYFVGPRVGAVAEKVKTVPVVGGAVEKIKEVAVQVKGGSKSTDAEPPKTSSADRGKKFRDIRDKAKQKPKNPNEPVPPATDEDNGGSGGDGG
jgi:hypothetical protein